MAASREVNPIPIHTPSELGYLYDFSIITTNEAIAFRNWVAEYKKYLLGALADLGMGQYVYVNGHKCFNNLLNWHMVLGTKNSIQFLKYLGFNEDDYALLMLFIQQPGDQVVSYIWEPTFTYSDVDFDNYVAYLKEYILDKDIVKYKITHKLMSYVTLDYPTEPQRIPHSILDLGYTITGMQLKTEDDIILESPNLADVYVFSEGNFHKYIEIECYDSSDNVVVVEEFFVETMKSIIAISLNSAITSLSYTKVSEEKIDEYTFLVIDEEVEISLDSLDYMSYACITPGGDVDPKGSCFQTDPDDDPFDIVYPETGFYSSNFWLGRNSVLQVMDPINEQKHLFEFSEAFDYWYLRADFDQIGTPDEIAYLISQFSTLQAYTIEEGGGLLKGIIGMIGFVAGAALAYVTGGTTTFLLRMSWEMLGFVNKQHQISAIEDANRQMATIQEQKQMEMANQAVMEAAIDNVINLDINNQDDIVNPYAIGLFNPFAVELDLPKNDFAYGGEYYSPHKKLIKELT